MVNQGDAVPLQKKKREEKEGQGVRKRERGQKDVERERKESRNKRRNGRVPKKTKVLSEQEWWMGIHFMALRVLKEKRRVSNKGGGPTVERRDRGV